MERPILFSAPMVRAILEGRKSMTRRVVKPQPPTAEAVRELCGDTFHLFTDCRASSPAEFRVAGPVWAVRQLCGQQEWTCPYGQPGDRLWVRETWCYGDDLNGNEAVYFKADSPQGQYIWKPSIYMPRKLSRVTLEVAGVRVERLQEITDADALAEGVNTQGPYYVEDYEKQQSVSVAQFAALWDSINGKKYPWDSNPFCWVIEFTKN